MTRDAGEAVLALLAPDDALAAYEPDDAALQDPARPPERPYGVVYVSNGPATNPRLSGRRTRDRYTVNVKIVADSAASCRWYARRVNARLEHHRPALDGITTTPLSRTGGVPASPDTDFKPVLQVMTDTYQFTATRAAITPTEEEETP